MIILFFSRGRGRGHAVPDMAIAAEITRLRPETIIKFASYGTGAKTLKASDCDVVDMKMPDANPYLETLFKAASIIQAIKPDVIIAHEEFAALAAARLTSCKSIFIAAWLSSSESLATESMQYADGVVVLEDAGIFPVPLQMQAKPVFTGPMLREMRYRPADGPRARAELSIPAEATVITVLPGSFVLEAHAPIVDTVVEAIGRFSPVPHLFWVAGKDHAQVKTKTRRLRSKTIIESTTVIEQVMVASDLVITKATRGATLDAAALGVPTISLSPRINVVDDMLVPRISSNTALTAGAVDGESLAWHIQEVLNKFPRRRTPRSLIKGCRPAGVAGTILGEIDRILLNVQKVPSS